MKYVNESIFFSTIRSLFTSMFSVFGALLGIVLVFLLFTLPFSNIKKEKALPEKAEILPDANGSRKKLDKDAPVILQIEIDNIIGIDEVKAEKIEEILLMSVEKELKGRVKGILLRMNTPGGSVFESYGIYSLLKEYQKRYKVPIHTFVEGLCASGGYYIACASDHIASTPVSLIGSIGVLSGPYINVAEGAKKIGVEGLVLSGGKHKADLNPFQKWEKESIEERQKNINFFYDQFMDVVLEARAELTREKLVQELGASVFPPKVAYKEHLIDEPSATRDEALNYLVHKAGIDEKTEYQVISLSKEPWWKKAFETSLKSPLLTGKVKHEMLTDSQPEQAIQYLYTP
jgi:protease IV